MMTDEQKELVEQNIRLVWWYILKHNLNPDEWFGSLSETLCKAAIKYDKSLGNKFSTYAKLAFDNCVGMEARKKMSKKQVPDCMVISGDKVMDPYGFDREICLFDTIGDKRNAIEDVLFFYDMERYLDRIKPRDKDMWKMAMKGMTNRQIGEKLNLSQATVNRVLNNIRKVIENEV